MKTLPKRRSRRVMAWAAFLALGVMTWPGAAWSLGRLFPDDNIWNAAVDALPVHSMSSKYINTIGSNRTLHPDFGSGTWDGQTIGIPYNQVSGTQAKLQVSFYYDDESDAGPYPIPDSPRIEGGSDHHILLVDTDNQKLYEIYDASKDSKGQWSAGSGAIWNLSSNDLRPAGWTSADAAGLPILPGLVRYDEVASGEIRHALRFTASNPQSAYVWPARHLASDDSNTSYPPYGMRFRLKAGYDISGFSGQVQVILQALKTYGMMLADGGGNWYISGEPDERWNNDVLHELSRVPGSAFEAVDVSSLMADPNSARVK